MKRLANPMTLYRRRDRILPRLAHHAQQWAAFCGTPLCANDRRLLELRDAHRGRRALIVGNGPSLRTEDLDRLHNEITFASNKIYLAFQQTAWRPTYYSVSDILVAKNNREAIAGLRLQKFFGSSVRAEFGEQGDVLWLRELPAGRPRFSTNCAAGVYGGYSVVYHQLQLAYHLGIREVYLIGLDFSFQVPQATGEESIHGPVLRSQGEVNHFHKDYRAPGEKWTMPRLDEQRKALQCARETFEARGGVIFNASRRTKLDVLPRIEFDGVIRKAA